MMFVRAPAHAHLFNDVRLLSSCAHAHLMSVHPAHAHLFNIVCVGAQTLLFDIICDQLCLLHY